MKLQKTITLSSNISKVDYDTETKVLGITFKNKSGEKRYEYQGVPRELYDQMIAAPSTGKFFYANIKGKYE